jgi:inorganic triphosphatase YgiF
MEIEAKFRIETAELFDTLVALTTLGDYTLQADAHIAHQRNTYYDTADGRLTSMRYGLRIREVDGTSIATIKGPNEATEGGMYQRAEWEIAAHDPDPTTWPAGEARNQAQKLLGDAPPVVLLSMETNRRHIIAMRDDMAVAELSLDVGTIQAKGRTLPFCELEIELLADGTLDDLEALKHALQAHVSLIPEERSKLEQGLALLEEETHEL